MYRGELWYVIQNPASGRQHRLSATAQLLVDQMNGARTVQEIWDQLDAVEFRDGDLEITQDEIIQLLTQLHAADLLNVAITPDTEEMLRRGQARQRSNVHGRFMNPLALRFPLLDPDRLLSRLLPTVRWAFSRLGLVIWLCIVISALVLAGMHWSELTDNIQDRVLTPGNLVLLWLTYPIIKTAHELSHGLAAKCWGGEVHEMGIMLLVFAPVPYVDASCSSSFPNKRQRMMVGAAGIFTEVLIAALAMFVWAAVEPGLVRAIAFNIMLIGAISTIVVNGNPLLRFDGYFVLADALEIPNLASRAKRYLGYLVRRYVFSFDDAYSPASTSGEAFWLAVYAVSSFAYRMLIMFAIILFVAAQFFIVGTLLACWAITMQLIWPALKSTRALTTSTEFQTARNRNLVRGALVASALVILLAVVPLPLSTNAQGVVWLPPESEIRAEVDAVITRVVAAPNRIVQPGEALFEMHDPELVAKALILKAELAEAEARYVAIRATDRVDAQIVQDEIVRIKADLTVAQERVTSLTVRSTRSGRFIIHHPQDLEGRFIRNGELLAFVANVAEGTIVVAVSQDEIGLIRTRTKQINFRLAEQLDEVIAASISRETPSATHMLPSAALGGLGGGRFATDPADDRGVATLEQIFQLELTTATPVRRFGERAYVRFDHGYQPLAWQWYRKLRQVFLRQLNV